MNFLFLVFILYVFICTNTGVDIYEPFYFLDFLFVLNMSHTGVDINEIQFFVPFLFLCLYIPHGGGIYKPLFLVIFICASISATQGWTYMDKIVTLKSKFFDVYCILISCTFYFLSLYIYKLLFLVFFVCLFIYDTRGSTYMNSIVTLRSFIYTRF